MADAAGGLPGTRGDVDRRPADLRRARQRRRLGATPSCSTWMSAVSRWSSPACRPTISARPASSGATRSTEWEAHAAEDYAWWAARLSLPARPGRHRPDRPFSRLRGVLGDPGRVADGRVGPLGRGPGQQRSSRPCDESSGISAVDRRRPGADHARRRGASRRIQPARYAHPSVWIRADRGRRKAPAAPVCAPLRRLHRHPRQRHDRGLVHVDPRRDHAIVGRDRGRAGLCMYAT